MTVNGTSEVVLWRFQEDFIRTAYDWPGLKPTQAALPTSSLIDRFLAALPMGRKRNPAMLPRCKCKRGENLVNYLDRFNEETHGMSDLDSIMVVGAILDGLRECPFLDSLTRDVPRMHPVMASFEIQDKKILKPAEPVKETSSAKRSGKFCIYHKVRGHTTENCIHLKDAIEDLVREGKLSEFLKQETSKKEEQHTQSEPPRKKIDLLYRGRDVEEKLHPSEEGVMPAWWVMRSELAPRRRANYSLN
ncbi:hypothetical protein J5N97_027796 [Dioscorea zingiberensis]|uniref:Retrotransposon gag domain-containing protein n=1 Tax=Dioscorea zingiberensis TaxID=325984 RepID=A0A9D5H4A4_9LILI|nr:hypothetical protein J5N97_027796 [Dioscorea zingiberensis]